MSEEGKRGCLGRNRDVRCSGGNSALENDRTGEESFLQEARSDNRIVRG